MEEKSEGSCKVRISLLKRKHFSFYNTCFDIPITSSDRINLPAFKDELAAIAACRQFCEILRPLIVIRLALENAHQMGEI